MKSPPLHIVGGGANRLPPKLDYAFANVLWDVTPRLTVGLEYQYADLERMDGESVDASRLQASALFHF